MDAKLRLLGAHMPPMCRLQCNFEMLMQLLVVPPVAMMSPGAESLDKMGILLSWMLNSWLQRWARWREQPLLSWNKERQEGACECQWSSLRFSGLNELSEDFIKGVPICQNCSVCKKPNLRLNVPKTGCKYYRFWLANEFGWFCLSFCPLLAQI